MLFVNLNLEKFNFIFLNDYEPLEIHDYENYYDINLALKKYFEPLKIEGNIDFENCKKPAISK